MKQRNLTQRRKGAKARSENKSIFDRFDLLKTAHFVVYFAVLVVSLVYGFSQTKTDKIQLSEKESAIENALYTKTEFFGANAIVPFPTEQARERLTEVLQKFPGDAQISLKLSELNEKLGRFDEAEQLIKAVKPENLPALAAFYQRRAQFEKEAEILEKIYENAPAEKRGEAFSNLINLAKTRDLKKYLSPDFYQKIIVRDDAAFSVFLQYIEKLVEEKSYSQALKILAENREKFPGSKAYFFEKEISVLILQGKTAEAVNVYEAAFNPLWTEDESQKFYDFLRENDRYRVYESNLRQNFKKNPGDFQTAIRLIHFERDDGEEIDKIVRKLENSRAEKKIAWQPDELLTVSHFLIETGNGDTASRFLYTLCAGFKLEKQSELRRKALYQLFELLSDAGSENLALTRGNLKFYENIAKTDVNPGITTGILSLIFSDTSPRREFEKKAGTAVALFNRAAAYRIFNEFKAEFADAPELAQMYLDIFRLYTNSKDLKIASQTLAEFEQKFAGFKDFPDASLKLADAYIAAKKFDKERETYQKLLDFLGKTNKNKFPQSSSETEDQTLELTQIKPPISAYPPQSNPGIETSIIMNRDVYYSYRENPYKNYLSRETSEISYSDVLERYVTSLARDNKTQEILSLYADETAKYPDEQRLFEQMLQWLGQTNMAERQFAVYQKALQKFPERTWQDRFARWLIRNKRQDDFENFSRGLIETFDDAETRDYLKKFIDGKEFKGTANADGKLYFALYSLARRRFPHNIEFVKGLLRYYRQNKLEAEWLNLLAEYFFESSELRQEFLAYLAKKGEIRAYLAKSENLSESGSVIESLPYKLFRAEAGAWVSDFEKSVLFYRELNRLYPNNPEFSESFISLARSFGQQNRNLLEESATFSQNQADNFPADSVYLTRAGEIQAELGNFEKARQNWEKLIAQSQGEREAYLETATVFWDYFQYDDALKTIRNLREKFKDDNLYAFQNGAIYEAKRETSLSISEYLKALDENENEDDKNRAKRRLKQLYARGNLAKEINLTFEKQLKRAKNPFRMAYNFADLLFQLKLQPQAVNLLKRQISVEKSRENLLEAKEFFDDFGEPEAERFALNRLIQTAVSGRDSISYRLRLAENYSEDGKAEKAAAELADLVKKFPKNYGVLTETENFYWEIGKRETSLQILQNAIKQARGEFAYQLSRKLAQRLNSLNRAEESEKILYRLHQENPNDEAVFSELADIFVRANKADSLRKIFGETIEAMKRQDLEPREFTWQTESLRKKMIAAFTRLKDYASAVEQHIEIINREPANEESVAQAISYVKRYGGAETLLEYYQKTANESFKNYRWNVVLAQIYEANGDLPNAAENYRVAIYNQPEMIELYESLNEIYVKMKDYESALKTLEKMLELSNEDKKYVKQKVEILEKLGKKTEAETEKQKLPVEAAPKPKTLQEQFTEAANLRNSETEKAIEKYREAFENLSQNPFQTELKSADITGYAQTVYKADSLGEISERLWNLREKLIAEIETPDSVKSGKAREMLKVLDGAMPEAIGNEVKAIANGNEISALKSDIENRLKVSETDKNQTLSLLQNLIARCGFDDLQERILIARLNESSVENRNQNLRELVKFYRERADFPRILEILENESATNNLEFLKIYAEVARILENREKEISALRSIFAAQKQDDEFTRRFLEILYETNRGELENLAQNSPAHQLQIINFLTSKKEFDLAKAAMRNSAFPTVWKSSRQAELSFAFNKFGEKEEENFVSALQIAPIGELVKQKSSDQNRLAGNDWFQLSNKYGKWLFAAGNKEKSDDFLPSLIEKFPKDSNEQFKLGYFYLQQNEFSRALEHLRLANELYSDNKSFLPYLGAAYFQTGDVKQASETWLKIIEGDDITFADAGLYLETLADFGQTGKARNDLRSFILENFKYSENKESFAAFKRFVRKLSESFSDESEKVVFFSDLCKDLSENSTLPQILIEDELVGKKDFGKFYEILIERADGLEKYEHDYDYVSILETNWSETEAEILLDSENNFEIEEPENKRLEWQKKYLDYLISQQDFSAAESLAAELEKSLKGHYARPVWLRLAKIRLEINKTNSAETLSAMKKFVGIEISANAQKANPPSLERFNETIKILRDGKRKDLILELQEAFYARQLALEQFNAANFIGLAKVEFQKGNKAAALELLQILTDFSNEETQAKLASMSLITKFANIEKLPVEAQNSLAQAESLSLAARAATEFGFYSEAMSFREKLLAVSLDDTTNRIELARLAAKNKTAEEAVKILLEIISDKNSKRSARWQSLIVLAEISSSNENFWEKLKSENQGLKEADAEIWNALEAFSLSQTGRAEEAIKFLENNDFTPQLKFLKAVFEKNSGQNEQALKSFGEILKLNDALEETFGFWENAPAFQMIGLYLETGKPRAAIELAKTLEKLKTDNSNDEDFIEGEDLKAELLSKRADDLAKQTHLKLLELLSNAAEETGDFVQAVEFEKARFNLLKTAEEQKSASNRLEVLKQKLAEKTDSQTNSFAVTEKPVSDF